MQGIESLALAGKGIMEIVEGSREYQYIENGFLKGMEFMRHATTVVALHKNNVSNSCLARQARLDSFDIFSKAVAIKCGGDANVKCAWYGGSLDELIEIVSIGFTGSNIHHQENDSHGVGIFLSPAKFSIDSAMCTVADEQGLRHVLLCRVILGNVEAVPSGSKQSQPSGKQYDTGVDDISLPRKHIIWTAFMNSHIHPHYILTFKFNHIKDPDIFGGLKPRSQYVSFPNLVARVSNHLKPPQMFLLLKSYRVYQELKISREEWIKKVRVIVGDRLLHSVITDKSASGIVQLL